MDVEVTPCPVEQKQVLKNLYTYWRYNRLKYIESGPGSYINDHGVIDGDTARTHDEVIRDEDWPWERPGWPRRPTALPTSRAIPAGRRLRS